jgi:hypothetical protein
LLLDYLAANKLLDRVDYLGIDVLEGRWMKRARAGPNKDLNCTMSGISPFPLAISITASPAAFLPGASN